ncbi:MAG: hypothetical protein R3B45_00455 [Bdellovibrionota bacterium]
MYIKTIISLTLLFAINNPLIAQDNYYKAGWSGLKVEEQAEECQKNIKADLCSLETLNDFQRTVCTEDQLRSLCLCLGQMLSSLLSYEEFSSAPLSASKTLQNNGAINRCLDDISEITR